MKIRYAKQSDFNLLVEGIEKIRFLERYSDFKAKPKDRRDAREAIRKKNVRVIEVGGKPVAFLHFRTNFKIMYIDERFLWVQRVYVKEKYRGKGLGKLLYNNIIKIAKKRGYKEILCDVYEVNKKSKKFHEKLGFKPIYAIYKKRI